jgi:hypothetical protein
MQHMSGAGEYPSINSHGAASSMLVNGITPQLSEEE